MTTNEIITLIMAGLSLIISGATAYLTLFSRFKSSILPKRRIILTQITGTPNLILECEFYNSGAKPGSIEDLMVTVIHDETGTEFQFAPYLVKSQFNIFAKYQVSDFAPFSGISLSSKDRRELYIAFKPLLVQFTPPKSGIFTIHTSAKIDGDSKWITSPRTFSLRLNDGLVEKWTGSSGEAYQIEAIEIGKSRESYFGHRKK